MLRYAITDRLLAPDEPTRRAVLVLQAERLAAAGIDFLQLREKDLPAAELATLARRLLAALTAPSARTTAPSQPAAASRSRPKLLINSRPDVALAAGADGVHLPASSGELTPAQVRAVFASVGAARPIISVSCHTLEDITRLASTAATPDEPDEPDERPDVILFGPVFEKRVHGELVAPGTGLDLLARACRLAAPTPVLALGGLTAQNTPAAVAAGAAGIASIRLFAPWPASQRPLFS